MEVALQGQPRPIRWIWRLTTFWAIAVTLRGQQANLVSCDNRAAISLIKNPEYRNKTKHADLNKYFIREEREPGKIDLEYINTKDQLADLFTKPLPRDAHLKLCDGISVTTISSDEWEKNSLHLLKV